MLYHYNRKILLTDTCSGPRPSNEHDHDQCVKEAIDAVEKYCKFKQLRLTPVRRKVLELLLKEHKALAAYDILDLLREAGFNYQPPVAYRALEFLVNFGFAHKIERLKAFVACSHPGKKHSPAFMICRKCDTVAETEAVISNHSLSEVVNLAGFEVEQTTLEAQGICSSCAHSSQV